MATAVSNSETVMYVSRIISCVASPDQPAACLPALLVINQLTKPADGPPIVFPVMSMPAEISSILNMPAPASAERPRLRQAGSIASRALSPSSPPNHLSRYLRESAPRHSLIRIATGALMEVLGSMALPIRHPIPQRVFSRRRGVATKQQQFFHFGRIEASISKTRDTGGPARRHLFS